MFAITGITGQVGRQLADRLLQAGHPVRAVLRDPAKAAPWRDRGCQVALADMADASALEAAFTGARGVFVLLPPCFDPAPGFAQAVRVIEALEASLRAAKPSRVVALSTIGAHAAPVNLLTQLQLMERRLGGLPTAVSFLRAAWFMENAASDIEPARRLGVMPSFLQPVDKPVPMVATRDIAACAAELLGAAGALPRIVELEGPARITPEDLAEALGVALQRPVRAEPVPRDSWEDTFRRQGMAHPGPRMRMLDGFNEGWIEFADRAQVKRGGTPLPLVLEGLVAASGLSRAAATAAASASPPAGASGSSGTPPSVAT